ncbi:MAG TPA: hypothetical protein VK102_12120, partial [Sphingobacterium sp.]|nr:hypothetical protein [Sphingobacterium sp.]
MHFLKTIIPLLVLSSLIGMSSLHAQSYEKPSNLLKRSQLKGNIDILGANISYEKRIGNGLTAYFDGGLTYGFIINGGLLYEGKQVGYELAPIVSASLRKYYNLIKRMNKGRNIKNNAANFISLKVGYRFTPIASKYMYASSVFAVEPSWGIQRNIGKHFSFEVAP